MTCARCGAPLAGGEQFCGRCGTPVPAVAQAPRQPAYAPAVPHQQAPGYAPPYGPAYAPAAGWPTQPPAGPRYAGFWIRFAAASVDALVLGIVWFIVSGLYELLRASILEGMVFAPDGTGLAWTTGLLAAGRWLLLTLLLLAYFALPEATRLGASLGKLLFRLRVARPDGRPAGFLRSTARTAFKVLSTLPLLFGFLMAAWSGRKQALHDLMSGCVVLRR